MENRKVFLKTSRIVPDDYQMMYENWAKLDEDGATFLLFSALIYLREYLQYITMQEKKGAINTNTICKWRRLFTYSS